MHVIATAGHVDHGKSTLVRALTGMEPDRWVEERRRGLTLDLGFAWTTLPVAGEVAFVDVPGHRRFIGNMLSGLGPAPTVALVVAADAGWREQTEEHLQAITALGISHGLLVITRTDIADPGPALAQARDRLERSTLANAPSVAVSAVTGSGLDELREALDRLCSTLPQEDPSDRVRLWIDRAFTIRGSGTVVTGTLGSGTVRVGDRLELAEESYPVRGLHSLGSPVEQITGPARVAVNLRGIAPEEIVRGDALLTPGAWSPTTAVDVSLGMPADDLPQNLTFHVGTAAVPARLRPLSGEFARVTWEGPLPLTRGDRCIVRDPGGDGVLTGARILDIAPPSLRRRGAAQARGAELAALAAAGEHPLVAEVERRGVLSLNDARLLGLDVGSLVEIGSLAELGRQGVARLEEAYAASLALVPLALSGGVLSGIARFGDQLVSVEQLRRWQTALLDAVTTRARTHLLDPALTLESARRAAGIPDLGLLRLVAEAAGLVVDRGRVHANGVRPDLGAAQVALDGILDQLAEDPCAAPEQPVLDEAGLDDAHLAAADADGQLLRLAGGIVLAPDSPERTLRVLAGLPQPFTTSQARVALGTTRRVVIPLLEHLDALGWTRRVDGSHRAVVAPPPSA